MSRKIENITRKQVLELLKSQNYKCAMTGWVLSPETASIDHVVPLVKGGDHSIDNAQIVDWRVNQAKGQMTCSEFIELCRAVALKEPNVGKALQEAGADRTNTDS